MRADSLRGFAQRRTKLRTTCPTEPLTGSADRQRTLNVTHGATQRRRDRGESVFQLVDGFSVTPTPDFTKLRAERSLVDNGAGRERRQRIVQHVQALLLVGKVDLARRRCVQRPARADVAGGSNNMGTGYLVKNQHAVLERHFERRRLTGLSRQRSQDRPDASPQIAARKRLHAQCHQSCTQAVRARRRVLLYECFALQRTKQTMRGRLVQASSVTDIGEGHFRLFVGEQLEQSYGSEGRLGPLRRAGWCHRFGVIDIIWCSYLSYYGTPLQQGNPAVTPEEFHTAIAATAGPFAAARTPPGRLFWDPALYERDLDEVFGRMWLCVGHQSRLGRPGDFFTVDLGRESIIVAADSNGKANAFLNVCRHRGTRVTAESSGNCRGFLCPYHAWHYGLDGQLRAAPGMDQVDGFRREDYPLLDVRLDTFLGFLFVNLDAEAEPLQQAFSDFPDLERYDLPRLERVARHEYEAKTNWKLICQNYHECYHCGIAHPQLHRVSDYSTVPPGDVAGRLFIGGPMSIKEGNRSMTLDGTSPRNYFPGINAEDTRLVHYFNLLPNFLLSITPDYVLTHHIWPRGPESVYIESEWFCAPEQTAADSFSIANAEEFWDITNRQDWSLCENALLGLKSRHHRPGRYHPGEDCSHRFDQWYVRRLFPDLAGALADTPG